jgi:chromosome segregation protein
VRLKSLEIKGFKSFADKTVVTFDEGITGIIGPNGCGKSNIIDSIRWVIGESKISALRSENLDSLVFNGSKTRNGSSMAEVSLTFENTKNLLPTEFSTITVTRRYYKNGESEYRLNDVACRLKDIHNLFMDTGVSTDSYAIIELGMVDDIIKDKDNSRRRMLEQAAGITIYKTRKKEAKNKLDATEQDLSRIEDLLFEINNQLKTLENQAKKAEKYFEIKKDYQATAIELAIASLEGFNISYKELTEQQDTETDKKVHLEAQIALEEAALEQDRVVFIEKERALQSLQHEFNEKVEALRTKQNEKNLAAQRLNYLNDKESNLQAFLERAEGQLKTIGDSIEYTKLQVVDEEKLYNDFKNRVETSQSELTNKRAQFDDQRSVLDGLRQQYGQIQRSQFDAEKKVAVSDTSIQNVLRSQEQLTSEQSNRATQIEELTATLGIKEADLTARKEHLAALQAQHEKAKAAIFETQAQLEVLRSNLADQTRILDAKKNEYDLLKSLVDSMEGYPESVKFLHKNTGWNHNAPILSDILYVQEQYRTAVENVLEPYLNYYVVNNLKEGMQAIQLLDDNKKGKANFFLLDQLNGAKAESAPANTIAALSVIEIDPQYAALANHLLGNVFIAENEAALEANSTGVILEKSGKYVKGKFTLTGGSVGLFEGKKIGRAKNLEKLLEDIQSQEKVVNVLKDQIQEQHNSVLVFNEQLKENEIRSTEQSINTLINEVFANKNRLENLQSAQANAVTKLAEFATKVQEEHAAIADTRVALEALNVSLHETQAKLEAIELAYQAAEQAYHLASGEFNEMNLQLTKQQSKIESLQQEVVFKENQLNDLHAQIQSNTAQLTEASTAIVESKEQLAQIEEALVSLIKTKEEEEQKLNEADQAYYTLRNDLQEKESALRTQIKSKELVDQLINEIKDKLNNLKLQLSGMKERLSVEFKVELEEVLDKGRQTEETLEELQQSAEKMKKRLENMGEVNPTAIEAYTEMKKRYDFILEQKNDLVTAKESLLQTIQEVEATANQAFLETYNTARENFQKVFKALFTEEDSCDLVLVDPDNLAETAVEIVAKPKGKRPSSITQLSGGERTLTATAMLFAIYLIKPAPFCILDEVDAPLDDANVGKFTQMIQKFSDNSQFIIVTHNKQTMSAVDVIYGVTMQEPGVSKLVPVDFRSLSN